MNYDKVIEEIESLKKIVNMLCVAVGGWQEEEHQSIHESYRSKVSYIGRQVMREACAKRRLEQLEHEKKILLEDYPSLYVDESQKSNHINGDVFKK